VHDTTSLVKQEFLVEVVDLVVLVVRHLVAVQVSVRSSMLSSGAIRRSAGEAVVSSQVRNAGQILKQDLKLNSLRLFLAAHRLSRFVLRFDATTVVVQALLPGPKL
jgi:hypothetical protein